jgi:hypothetical protein
MKATNNPAEMGRFNIRNEMAIKIVPWHISTSFLPSSLKPAPFQYWQSTVH